MKRRKTIKENKVEYGTISLPIPLIKKIHEKIKGTGMNSVSSYVAFILRQIFSESSEENFNKQEQATIRQRLKNLGYI